MNGYGNMDNLILKITFIIVSLNLAATDVPAVSIDCKKTFEDITNGECDATKVWKAYCQSSCVTRYKELVYGTVYYSKDSAVCRSAVHDARISNWNNSMRTVSFRCANEKKQLISSLRQKIKSETKRAALYYTFISPRIKEEILDIILLHHNYIFQHNDQHKQECRIAEKPYHEISFNAYNGGPGTVLPNYKVGPYIYYKAIWKEDSKVRRAFWCRPSNNMLSSIPSVVMREDADFLPAQLTITASVGDNVKLMLQPVIKKYKLRWRKDDDRLPLGDLLYRNFEKVQIADTGLYTLENDWGQRNRSGAIRLIVRVCEKDKYGPSCEHNCSKCLNGGVCHDITGECICPPGFNESDCRNGCGEGRFGKVCTQKCYNKSGAPISCKEILFCLPDPYGCSCISGYRTLYCNETCNRGWYGAGCSQACSSYCNDSTKEICDPYTGYCTLGCKDGWHGNSCFHSYPVLRDPPTAVMVGTCSITVWFKEWKHGDDIGDGEVRSYLIQYTMCDRGSTNWGAVNQVEVNQTRSRGNYSVTIKNLTPNTQYCIRVIVVDESGSKQTNNISETKAHTKCGTPQQPPINVTVNTSMPRSILVKWQLPSHHTWQCDNVTVTLSYIINNSNKTIEEIKRSEFSFKIDPYTNFSVKLRTVSKNGFPSNWSSDYKGVSAEDAPSHVRNISFNPESRLIELSWNKPLNENGIIRQYKIEYHQIGWLHKCSYINSTISSLSTSNTEASIDVKPSALYEVKIFAITVKEGNGSKINVSSTESIPDGPPNNLTNSSVNSKELSFKWDNPSCDIANGNVTKYKYRLNSLDDWDEEDRNGTLSKREKTIKNLIPYTSYTFQVFAGTSIGFSEKSANITITTLSEKPPPPSDLVVYHRTANLLSLSWKPPFPPYGKLQQYSISYTCDHCSANKGDEKNVTIDKIRCSEKTMAHLHCYVLTELEPNKNYSIKVWAFNEGIRKGGECVQEYGVTMESVPEPPSHLELRNNTETSLNITWSKPQRTNGNLTEYRINITAVESFNKTVIGREKTEITDPNNMDFFFQDLYPATKYNVTIEAKTSVGYGLPIFDVYTTKHSVPNIEFEPEILHVTDTTIVLKIMPITFLRGPISGCFVIVQEAKTRRKRNIEEITLISYNTSRKEGFDYYVAAEFLPEEFNSEINFTVGDGKIYGRFYNVPLVTGNRYILGIIVSSNYSGEVKIGQKFLSRAVKVESPKGNSLAAKNIAGTVIGILFAIVIFFLVVLAIMTYRNPKWIKKIRRQNVLKRKNVSPADKELIDISTDTMNVGVEKETSEEERWNVIPVSKLEEYVQNALQSGLLGKEFASVEKGQRHSWGTSKLPENRSKNRYGNLLAYDHTRVILNKIPGDSYSDYINANFVDGYRKQKKYIATQGPKPTTIADFWRMIWQENVLKIIMCTNLVENGKIKCEKYWPDGTETYGFFQISLVKTDMFTDYVIRTLRIVKEGQIREVKHFHFTTWPDHGVPMYATAVVNFMNKTRTYQPTSNSPIVIHCSAGVGRTGTLILIDSMLDMAAVEQSVELTTHLRNMRDQRVNLVETLDQYCFVYHALIDGLCREHTSIFCSDYYFAVRKMKEIDPSTGKTAFHEQFQHLSKICPPLKIADSWAGVDQSNQHKNRNMKIIPPNHARPILVAPKGYPNSTYINAVFVDGYRKKDAFIVTQIPLPETIPDFWNMLYYSETNSIVLLNALEPTDESSPQYWPETSKKFYDIEVNQIERDDFGEIAIRTFELRKQKDEVPKIIKQFHITNWLPSDSLPPSDGVILYLIEKIERWQQQCKTKSVVVQCLDGVRACGIYCTTVFICDKMKAEQEVDVFLAVKSIRNNRPEFIENEEQYIYCHQIALSFLDSFETYANFQ